MRIIQAPLLAGFRHGFTTRAGGGSAPPFDSLNLGGGVGDDPAAVAANWSRLEHETGLRFARVRQVHGARVFRADAPGARGDEEADVVLSAVPGVAACVSVADCVPVLLADPHGGAAAAVHAGWRGTLARAAAEAVRALAEAGAPADRLVAAVGPSIGPCCYEVSPDLAARFAAELGAAVVREGARPRLDLWAANAAVLRGAGLSAERIEVLGRCTACEREVFFSHRRDAGRTGRQVAFIAPRPPTGAGGVP